MIVPERVFWTEDRSRLVFEDDPDARFLAYLKGEDVGDLTAAGNGLDRLVAGKYAKTKVKRQQGALK